MNVTFNQQENDMKRLNITFYDEIIEKLSARTKIKKCGSNAQSVRELVDLGFQIEEVASRKNEDKSESDGLSFMMDAMKNNLKWTLEILLIARQMMELLSDDDNENTNEMLKKCKEQAMNHIKKIFSELGETMN